MELKSKVSHSIRMFKSSPHFFPVLFKHQNNDFSTKNIYRYLKWNEEYSCFFCVSEGHDRKGDSFLSIFWLLLVCDLECYSAVFHCAQWESKENPNIDSITLNTMLTRCELVCFFLSGHLVLLCWRSSFCFQRIIILVSL